MIYIKSSKEHYNILNKEEVIDDCGYSKKSIQSICNLVHLIKNYHLCLLCA